MVGGKCWVSLGHTGNTRRKGVVFVGVPKTRRQMAGHRLAYSVFNGRLKAGQVIHHRCENPACYNPNHLEQLGRADHQSEHRSGVASPISKAKLERMGTLSAELRKTTRKLDWADTSAVREYKRHHHLATKWVNEYLKQTGER